MYQRLRLSGDSGGRSLIWGGRYRSFIAKSSEIFLKYHKFVVFSTFPLFVFAGIRTAHVWIHVIRLQIPELLASVLRTPKLMIIKWAVAYFLVAICSIKLKTLNWNQSKVLWLKHKYFRPPPKKPGICFQTQDQIRLYPMYVLLYRGIAIEIPSIYRPTSFISLISLIRNELSRP